MKLIKNGIYWFLDYLYVFKTEVLIYFRRDSVDRYRRAGGDPVLLLPGIFENWRFIRPLAKLLYAHGYDVHVLDELGYNTGTIEAMVLRVESYCQHYNLQDVTLIAHSKGGYIGKQLLINDRDHKLFKRLITLNTPFTGSIYATYLPIKMLRIFSPRSSLFKKLAENTVANERITAIYGLFDPHIPKIRKLEGARNIQLPVYGHFRPISDKRVHNTLLKLLSEAS